MSQAGIRRTVAPRPFPMSGSRVAGRASTPRSGSLHPSRSPAPADQDRFGRLRAAILRLVGGDAGRRVAVLIADGDERLGVVADVALAR